MPEQAVYSHGHHASVVKAHARRTAQNSAGFLLPHIKPHYKILDVGCGPGSITVDLAQLVPEGSVIGIDAAEDILAQARDLARSRGVEANLDFRRADANDLPFADGEFDIVFCHQLLHHVADPVGILREMGRVARGGGEGIVAAREADWPVFAWYPEEPAALTRWRDVQVDVIRAAGGQPSAGRYLRAWAAEAGFSVKNVEFSWDAWTCFDQEAVDWAEMWQERTLRSGYASTALQKGLATQEELEGISAAWGAWKAREGALMIAPSGQILCRVR